MGNICLESEVRSIPVPVWEGELYLELHQGTLTSQAQCKQLNRQCESLMRSLEALTVQLAMVGCDNTHNTQKDSHSKVHFAAECHQRLRHLWKTVLLNQFHDVIREYTSRVACMYLHVCCSYY